jgi:hypothetical protein
LNIQKNSTDIITMADQPPRRQSRRVQDTAARQEEQRERERQEEQARAREEEIERARLRTPAEEEQQSLERKATRLANALINTTSQAHVYHELVRFENRIGMRKLVLASTKIRQLKQRLTQQSRQQIHNIVLLMFQIEQKIKERHRWDNIYYEYREQTHGHVRPPLGNSRGEERNNLRAQQAEYDRTMTEASRSSTQASRDLDELSNRLNQAIGYEEPPEIIYPDTDDEDEEGDEEEALEVHRKAAEVGSEALEKLLKALNNPKKDSDYPEPITEYVKEKFEEFIDVYPQYNSNTKREMKKDLGRVLKKFQSARETVSKPINRKIIGNIVDFVIEQPDDFRDSFISSYVHECANAYPRAKGDARLSCVNGILERFYLGLAHYLSTICPGTKETCPQIYRRINKALNKVAYEDNNELKNEFIQEWAAEHLKENDGKTKEQRRKSFVHFMQDKYKELYGEDELEEATIKMIDELANQYDYAFDSGAFGGAKKIRRKRTTKKSKKTNARKTNKR